MKILVFSDSHLTKRFKPSLFNYLSKLINSVDQVIINGDFWDSYFICFDEFVNSEWQKLFPLLKQKNTVYLYGNHDKKSDCDARVSLFCDQALDQYQLEINQKKYHFEHGDRLIRGFDAFQRYHFFVITRKYWFLLSRGIEVLFSKIVKYNSRKILVHRIFENLKMEKNIKRDLIKADVVVTGHIHLSKKIGKYINDGSIGLGLASYLLIDDGNPKIIKETY